MAERATSHAHAASRGVRNGGHILADALVRHGVDLVFGVAGESYLDLLDGLYERSDEIQFVGCRHEAAAANMAVACGRLTRRPGVCAVSRGPGATHASIGVHIAAQDSAPMLLLVGQAQLGKLGRQAFQEIDYSAFFGSVAKWVGQASSCSQIPELVSRAFHFATAGRPGPVVLALPEDVLSEVCDVADLDPLRAPRPVPAADELEALEVLLTTAERPVVIAGETGWTPQASRQLRVWCEARDLPVVASFRSQDVIDNRSLSYVGHLGVGGTPGLAKSIVDADFILAIGTRLDDLSTRSYSLIKAPRPKQRFAHVHPDPAELGRVFLPDLPIVASPEALLGALRHEGAAPPSNHATWTAQLRQQYEDAYHNGSMPGPLNLAAVIRFASEHLPDDAVITNGAGNFTGWVHRFFQFKVGGTQVAPIAGAMGFGLPAAVAAQIVHRDRVVVCFAGDGCFMMSAQELATAMQYELPIIVVVINNGSYGTIRTHQERRYPGRVIGTDLANPDFVAFGASFGMHTERVSQTAEFGPAFQRALSAGKPSLVEVQVTGSLAMARE